MCKKYQVKEIFCTAWMDNGAETPVDTVLPGVVLFAHLGFHDKFEEETFAEEFEITTGVSLETFLKLDRFDRLFLGEEANIRSENPSKYLLYQDALLGIFDAHLEENMQAGEYYKKLFTELKSCEKQTGRYETLFVYYRYLEEVLADKAELGIRIKKAYDKKELSTLVRICEEDIPRIIENMWKLKEYREKLWMKNAKPFGFELLDLRMGNVIIRLESSRRRLNQYIQGKTEKLEELEGKRLPYFREGEAKIENRWQRTISGADLTDSI